MVSQFHIQSTSSPAVALPPLCPCHEENLNRLSFSLLPEYSSFTFQSDLIHNVALQTEVLNTSVLADLATFDFSFQVQILVCVKYFIGKTMRCYLREKTVPHSSFTTRSRTKKQKKKEKKVFINLNEHIFSDICAFIYCVFLYKTCMKITPCDDISEPLWSSAGKLNGDGNICPFILCFQCTY